MEIVFDKSFSKSLNKLSDSEVKNKIIDIITEIESATVLAQVSNIKKMQGFKTYYRIRIGDYRLGIELETNLTVRFIVVLHRKDIYKKFP